LDIERIKEGIKTNVYHITAGKNVTLHNHPKHDEVFYCISGEGYGVLENTELELSVGKAFIVPSSVMHALRTNTDLYVSSFLIPIITD
jgi:mannose-6-phosphate isomerase-like protein (cupin superfamily)